MTGRGKAAMSKKEDFPNSKKQALKGSRETIRVLNVDRLAQKGGSNYGGEGEAIEEQYH